MELRIFLTVLGSDLYLPSCTVFHRQEKAALNNLGRVTRWEKKRLKIIYLTLWSTFVPRQDRNGFNIRTLQPS